MFWALGWRFKKAETCCSYLTKGEVMSDLTTRGQEQMSSCFHAFKIISGNIQVICIIWYAPNLYLHPLPDRNPRVTRQDLNPNCYWNWFYMSEENGFDTIYGYCKISWTTIDIGIDVANPLLLLLILILVLQSRVIEHWYWYRDLDKYFTYFGFPPRPKI